MWEGTQREKQLTEGNLGIHRGTDAAQRLMKSHHLHHNAQMFAFFTIGMYTDGTQQQWVIAGTLLTGIKTMEF